jgi:1,4-dihydroxy-2-naphthoyl-CoA hydrolase
MGHALDIRFLEFAKEKVRASMPVNENTIQPFGILHGGASVALAETIASIGAWLNIDESQKTAVGVEINANHIRAIRAGSVVTATAVPVHRGRQIQVWEVKIRTQDGKLVCISRCTLAVVDNRES